MRSVLSQPDRGYGFKARHEPDPLTPVPSVAGRPARIPQGVRIYAIGDLHGRADLLARMHRRISLDAEALPASTERWVVYLGDYVDRGLQSRQVLDLLIEQPLPGFRSVHLIGNHEAWLLDFLADPEVGRIWLRNGAETTLHSYGMRMSQRGGCSGFYKDLQKSLIRQMPGTHVGFLEELELALEFGDYFLVHAGVRPAVPLDRQDPDDLLMIREPFLSSTADLGRVVVHGHTFTADARPVVRHNRIGIDSGAYCSGCLTCLVLEGDGHRFLTTSP